MKFFQTLHDAISPLPARLYQTRRGTITHSGKPGGEYVVFLPFRINPGASWLELTLARAFRARGFIPLIGLGERAVKLTDGYLISDNRLLTRHLNLFRSDRYVRSFGEEPMNFCALLGAKRLIELRAEAERVPLSSVMSYTKFDVNLGKNIDSSLCRFFLRSEARAEEEEWAAREFLFTALVSLEAARTIHSRYKPRLLISSHGIYASWGVFCDYFKSVDSPFVTWAFQYKKNAFLMSHNQNYHKDIITEDPEMWRNEPLSTSTRNEVLEYVLHKGSASHSDNLDYYNSTVRLEQPLRDLLCLPERNTIFGMFPNLGWDAKVSFQSKFFPTMNEWLITTVKWFASRPNLSLIIRAHPAEIRANFETLEKTADILASAFKKLPPNVHLLAPDAVVSSYNVLSEIDGALIFGSKFGLEAAIRGKPVITAAESYFRGKGVSFDPCSKTEYFELIERVALGLKPNAQMLKTAIRFGYHYHVRRQIILPLAKMQGAQFLDYMFEDEAALEKGGIAELDHLINKCLDGGHFYALNTNPTG